MYSVEVFDGVGCSAMDTISVIFSPDPVVNLGADTSGCQGGALTLNAGNAGSTYAWSNSASTQTIGVTTSGTYSVVVTNGAGCTGSDTVNVTIHPLPSVSFTAPADTVCTVTAPITLSGGSPAGGAYSGTGVSAGMFDPAAAGVGSHVITYDYTDANGCSNAATVTVVVEVCAGVDAGNSLELGIYPNPNDGLFKLVVPVASAGDLRYEIADPKGVVVQRGGGEQPSGMFEASIDLSNYASGMYSIRVMMHGHSAAKRIVVQH
jgi:hypothetical protein